MAAPRFNIHQWTTLVTAKNCSELCPHEPRESKMPQHHFHPESVALKACTSHLQGPNKAARHQVWLPVQQEGYVAGLLVGEGEDDIRDF